MTVFHSGQERSWTEVSPGVHFCYLRCHEGGGLTILARMKRGAHAPFHDHPGGEETYMISGRLRIGEVCLQAGGYLWTPPGVVHDGVAEEDAEFFLVLPAGLRPAGARAVSGGASTTSPSNG